MIKKKHKKIDEFKKKSERQILIIWMSIAFEYLGIQGKSLFKDNLPLLKHKNITSSIYYRD